MTQPDGAPNAQSRWRIQLARQVGTAYARNPNVAAVLIAGSAARGYADRYSDIELIVCWHEPPSEAERRQIVEPLAADHRLRLPAPAC